MDLSVWFLECEGVRVRIQVGDHVWLEGLTLEQRSEFRMYQFLHQSPEIWEVIGTMSESDTGIVLDTYRIFTKVLLEDGRIGWIASANLQVIP